MKFVKETTSKGLQIPAAAMKLSGFESGGKVELHASEDTLVVLKQRMTAMELLRAAQIPPAAGHGPACPSGKSMRPLRWL